jgi:hypothetical protein
LSRVKRCLFGLPSSPEEHLYQAVSQIFVLLSFALLNLNKNGQQDCNSNVGEFLVRHRKEGECKKNSGKKASAKGGESRVLFVLYFWVGFSVWPNCGGNTL